MKVLMVTNMYPSEVLPGWGVFVKDQIDSIRKEGIDIEVFVIEGYKNFLNYFKAIVQLRKKVRSHSYDLIHAHYGLSGIVARMQFRLPVVVSFCGDDLLGKPTVLGDKTPFSRLLVWAGKRLARHVDAVIVKSDEMYRLLPEVENAHVIPNGVDFDRFYPMPKKKAREELGLKQDGRYVLFVGNPRGAGKCFWVVHQAMEYLSEDQFQAGLVILHAQRHDLVPLYMNACDVLVLSSYSEGSPNVVKEAMACNLPIVSVDVGDVRELIGKCEGCYIVERTPDRFSEKVKFVLSHNKRTNGRKFIEHLRLESVAKKIVNVYHGILQTRAYASKFWVNVI